MRNNLPRILRPKSKVKVRKPEIVLWADEVVDLVDEQDFIEGKTVDVILPNIDIGFEGTILTPVTITMRKYRELKRRGVNMYPERPGDKLP